MSLAPIPVERVCQLFERQTGGLLPTELHDADWYSSADSRVLGVIVQLGGAWGFGLFRRDEGGHYYRAHSGTGRNSRLEVEQEMQSSVLERSARFA